MEIKGAIFDLDGTLFDSLWVWAEIDKRFLNKRGFDVPEWYSEAISAMSFADSAKFTVKEFGLKEPPEQLMREWMDMSRDIYAHEIMLKKDAKELLTMLKDRGIKLGIATSSAPDLYMPALKNNGIDGMFDVIADTSNSLDKTHPDIFIEVARQMGLAPNECVVFEDLPTALASAKSGGFLTVAVRDVHTSDGLDADLVIDEFAELIALIKNK